MMRGRTIECARALTPAFCSRGAFVMRLIRAVPVVTLVAVLACQSGRVVHVPECPPPPPPSVPPQHTIRQGQSVDTAYARAGFARLVFHIRSAGPSDLGEPLGSAAVYLFDSLASGRALAGRRGDSTGVVFLDSVPYRHMTARVVRLAYVGRTFPILTRAGYSDTIHVTMAADRICPL